MESLIGSENTIRYQTLICQRILRGRGFSGIGFSAIIATLIFFPAIMRGEAFSPSWIVVIIVFVIVIGWCIGTFAAEIVLSGCYGGIILGIVAATLGGIVLGIVSGVGILRTFAFSVFGGIVGAALGGIAAIPMSMIVSWFVGVLMIVAFAVSQIVSLLMVLLLKFLFHSLERRKLRVL